MMPGCVWSRSHLPAAAPRSPARKYISIFSIIFYIWHHLQPRRGDGDTSFTHNRGRRRRWRTLLVKLPVLRWSGGRGRVGAFVRHQAGGGEAVNTLSSLFTISHKFGRPVSRPQCPVSCFPFCCFINKIFGAFLLLLLLLLPILSVGTKRSYRASPGHWWRLVAAGRGIGMEMGSEECELL